MKTKDSNKTCATPIFVVTTTSTITEPASAECDGIPRARSIGESVITYTTTVDRNSECPHLYKDIDDMHRSFEVTFKEVPTCRVPIPECSESWNSYKAAFADWNQFNATFPDSVNGRMKGACKTPLCSTIADMAGLRDHLFINCTEVLPYLRLQRALSMDGRPNLLGSDIPKIQELGLTNDSPSQELDTKLDEIAGCDVMVDQSLLLYFKPDFPKSRNICASSGFGEFFSYPYYHKLSNDRPISAVVSTVTFNEHDLRNPLRKYLTFCSSSNTFL